MSYNQIMSNKQEEKEYTREEIKNMSYWQLWGLRRKTGLWYFLVLGGIYSFLIYAFFKALIILGSGDTLKFVVDLWAIPIFILAGPLYYLIHELYYKHVYLKKKS